METIAQKVERVLRERLDPVHLQVLDDSDRHAGHPGATSGGAHLQVVIVAARFEGLPLLEQHRIVYDCVQELFGESIHALGLKTVPPSRWKG